MRVSEFISTFRNVMGDAVTPYLWSDGEIAQYLTWAEQEAAVRAKLLKDSVSAFCTISFTAGQVAAQLDASIFEVDRVSVNGKRLHRTTIADLDAAFCGWESHTSNSPGRYVHDGRSLMLVPRPNVAVVANLTVFRLPVAALSVDFDFREPEIDRMHHPRLLDWVYRCALLKNDSEVINPTKAAEYEAKFIQSFGIRNDANVMRKHKDTTTPVVQMNSGW